MAPGTDPANPSFLRPFSARPVGLAVLALASVAVIVGVFTVGAPGDQSQVAGGGTTAPSVTASAPDPEAGSVDGEPAGTAAPTTAPEPTEAPVTTFANLDGDNPVGEELERTEVNSAEAVAYDMFGPALGTEDSYTGGADGWDVPWPNHEASIMNDGTAFRWLNGGSASKWNVPGEEEAIYARCKVVPPEGGVGPTDFILQVRGMESWQRVDGEWSLHQTSDTAGMEGDWYDLADFLSDQSIDAELSDGTSGTSGAGEVYEVAWPENGEIFHFFMGKDDLESPAIRQPFDPDFDPATDAFFATAQLRIVAAEGSDIDLDDVTLLGNCGLDFYLNETSTRRRDYDGPVPSAGHPRSKFVSAQWQSFNWYTLPGQPDQTGEAATWQDLRQEILEDPPPINQPASS